MNCKRAICEHNVDDIQCQRAPLLGGFTPILLLEKQGETDLGGSILTGDSVGPQLEVRLSSSNLGVVGIVQVTVDDLFGEGHRGVVQSARQRIGDKGGEEEAQTGGEGISSRSS